MPSPRTTRSDSATIVSRCEPFNRPSVQLVPVAGEGQASRTNQQSAGSVTAGRVSGLLRSCQTERYQPVKPVPVPVRIPDDDCRSSKPSGVIRQCCLLGVVALLELFQRPTATGQEEAGLLAGAVPNDQLGDRSRSF
jgi:hypothetical protein